MAYIPPIKPWDSFSDAEIMFRRHLRNRSITFDKTVWMDWDEKVKMCILVIKFLKTYYFQYDKIKDKCPFILKKVFSLKGKSIQINELTQCGCFFAGYEFRLGTFWDYEVGVGSNNTQSGKFALYDKAEDWYFELLQKMYNKIGEQATSAILNKYRTLSNATDLN